jgi:hypothetical protein
MPVVAGLALGLLGLVVGYVARGSTSASTTASGAAAAGAWQALRAPFTLAPGASVVMVEMPSTTAGYPPGVTPLSTYLNSLNLGGTIVGYQAFPPGATLPVDWPSADTYGPTALRYEFTYPQYFMNSPSNAVNPTLTPAVPPLAAWQLVPATPAASP